MTREEFIVRFDCAVEHCEYGAKPYPVGIHVVPLCNGHRGECDHRGREAFEAKYDLDLGLLAAMYAEAYRQMYWRAVNERKRERGIA